MCTRLILTVGRRLSLCVLNMQVPVTTAPCLAEPVTLLRAGSRIEHLRAGSGMLRNARYSFGICVL
jgi:hypothetical protein